MKKKINLILCLFAFAFFAFTNNATAQETSTFPSTDIPHDIPDNGHPAGVTSTIDVPAITVPTCNSCEEIKITDINVDIEFNHTWIGDLTFTLTAPNGSSVVLVDGGTAAGAGTPANGPGSTPINFNDNSVNDPQQYFQDNIIDPLIPGGLPGQFLTDEQICVTDQSPFGLKTVCDFFATGGSITDLVSDATGTWSLEVTDDAGLDSGTLTGWALNITTDCELKKDERAAQVVVPGNSNYYVRPDCDDLLGMNFTVISDCLEPGEYDFSLLTFFDFATFAPVDPNILFPSISNLFNQNGYIEMFADLDPGVYNWVVCYDDTPDLVNFVQTPSCVDFIFEVFPINNVPCCEDIRMDGDNATFEFVNGDWVAKNAPIIIDCDDVGCRGEYTDDGGRLWNYDEEAPTRVWTFCPEDPSCQVLEIEFTMFDMGTFFGDIEEQILYGINAESIFGDDIFGVTDYFLGDVNGDGDLDVECDPNNEDWSIYIPFGETGVPDAPLGGKVTAGCESTLNGSGTAFNTKTGCLSVFFNPGNDDAFGELGAGWTFKVICKDREVEVVAPDDTSTPSVHLLGGLGVCAFQGYYEVQDAVVNCAPDGTGDCKVNDDVLVAFLPNLPPTQDQLNNAVWFPATPGEKILFTPILDGADYDPFTGCFSYYAIYIADTNGDGSGHAEFNKGFWDLQELWVCPPALVCNDELNVSLNADCTGYITPDHVLEDPCLLDLLHYTLVLEDENGNPIPNNLITKDHVGTQIKVIVQDKFGQVHNSCWTLLNIEDNIPPYFKPIPNDYIYCTQGDENGPGTKDYNWNNIYVPREGRDFNDNCMADIKMDDWVMDMSCDDYGSYGNYKIIGKWTKKWTVFQTTAGSHINEVHQTQTVYILQPHVYDPWTATVSCDLPADGHGGHAPSPEALEAISAGYVPHFLDHDGGFIPLPRENHATCKWVFHYEDSWQIPTDCGYKVFRHWQWYNWCEDNHVQPHEYTQVIEVTDGTKPTITCPRPGGKGAADDPYHVGTNRGPFKCAADVALGAPTANDNCDPDPNVVFLGVFAASDANATNKLYDDLSDIGLEGCSQTFFAMWTAYDKCGNKANNCRTYFTIYDDDEPVCVADEYTVVPLDDVTGTVTICADNLDSGSYDNCTDDVKLYISKSEAGPYSKCLELSCADMFNGELDNDHDPECPGTVNVWFKAVDDCDNYSLCMVEVELQDKIKPVLDETQDKTKYCDEVDDPYSLFTVPGATDNCSTPTVEEVRRTGGYDCGKGAVTITWRATDACGNYAETSQTVTLLHRSDFVVTFPADVEEECVDINQYLDPQPGSSLYPKVTDDDCEQVYINKTDKIYYTDPGVCYKIVRTWTAINWCVYDVQDGDIDPSDDTQLSSRRFRDGGDGYIKYVQVLKVRDDIKPIVTCDATKTFDDQTAGCEGPVTLTATVSDECTPHDKIETRYTIISSTGTVVVDGASGTSYTGILPYGSYSITWTALDGCGNQGTCTTDFTIRDKKKPGIVCISFLSAELMPIDTDGDGTVDDGMAEIWAREFVQSYGDNCPTDCDPKDPDTKCFLIDDRTGDDPGNIYGGNVPGSPPASAKTGLQFTCADQGTRFLAVWARDKAGNWDLCSAFLELQNNMGACGTTGTGSIAGTIETEAHDMVEDVTVELTGENMTPFYTGFDGAFSFLAPMGGNYTVVPEKDMNPLNGVTTYDLVLISQHILATKELDSPYKLIAADVNKSGTITGSDIISIRKLILNKISEFPGNTSWRFVDAEFSFPEPTAPWSTPFPEVKSVNLANGNANADFIGIKIGDVDGNALANNVLGSETRNATGALLFNANDALISAGQTYTVEFKASDMKNIAGYQFTMNFNADLLNFVDVEAAELPELGAANFNLDRIQEGVITTSWNSNETSGLNADDVLFTMTFTAMSEVKLSEAISINSRYTTAEAYTSDLNLMDVAIDFNTTVVSADNFELYQNMPNPFGNETKVGFNLPQASNATLTVYDVTGKMLRQYKGEYAKGYNEITINRSDLSSAGVLYYQLDTATESATKKMIMIK